MLFKRNVPGWERIVRAVVAIGLLIAVVAVSLAGMVGWIVGLSGAGLLTSSLLGFCPACALVGRRLP